MKKLFILCLFIISFCFSALHAQKVNLGIKGKKSEGELLTTNPKFSNVSRYYKNIPFDLKAGQGIVFFMQTTAFTPVVLLLGKDGKAFGTQRELKTEKDTKAKEARVAFIAQTEYFPGSKMLIPADSSFQVIFTSLEDNATGKFSFGFKLIDSAQMDYSGDNSFCDRLNYLINHWQTEWDLIPESAWTPVAHPGNFTKFTLMPDKTGSSLTTGTGWIESTITIMAEKVSYYERMFQSSTDKGKGSAFYEQVVNDIKQCLGDKNWVFESGSEVKQEQNYNSILNYARHISYFNMKGASKDQPKASFKIIWNAPLKPNEAFPYEVLLIFK